MRPLSWLLGWSFVVLSCAGNPLTGCALAADGDAAHENWPQFRGPTGLGYSAEKNLPLMWGGPTHRNVVWTSPLRGAGHASPIVWNDAVFVCTVQWPGNGEADEAVMPAHHVARYRVTDGKLVWDTVVPPGPWLRNDFRSGAGGGYAGPTPATDGKLVYCVFGSAVVAALDFQGKIVWRKELAPRSFDVTVGSSPILYQDTVILLCAMANSSDSNVVAFDKATGSGEMAAAIPRYGVRPQYAGLDFGGRKAATVGFGLRNERRRQCASQPRSGQRQAALVVSRRRRRLFAGIWIRRRLFR